MLVYQRVIPNESPNLPIINSSVVAWQIYLGPMPFSQAAIPALDMAMVDRSKSETAAFLRSFSTLLRQFLNNPRKWYMTIWGFPKIIGTPRSSKLKLKPLVLGIPHMEETTIYSNSNFVLGLSNFVALLRWSLDFVDGSSWVASNPMPYT